MNKNILSAAAGLLIAASLLPINAQACVTKSGKDCTNTVGHKVEHKVKLGKVAPAANVGAIAHTSAPVALGQAGAATGLQVGPATQEIFYIAPERVLPDGRRVASQFMPAVVMRSTTGLVNPDGSLTQHAIDLGWLTISVNVPGKILYPSVPTPSSVPTPPAVPSVRGPAVAPAQPFVNGHMQVVYLQLAPATSPGATREVTASYTVEQMRSQGLIDQSGRLTQRARQQGFATTISPLPGVRYYRTQNGRQIPLTPQQVQMMIQGGGIGIDGALAQASINQGFSMVINRPADPLPQQLAAQGQAAQQMAVPGLAAADKAPAPQQVAVPNLAPQPLVAPGYAVPGNVPTPQQVAVPNQAPQQLVTPGYAVPGNVPTPQQVLVPTFLATPVLAGRLSKSPAARHINGPVEVYHPLHGSNHDYADAVEMGDPAFHFVVVGFKERKSQ